jgi:hypothetical protein
MKKKKVKKPLKISKNGKTITLYLRWPEIETLAGLCASMNKSRGDIMTEFLKANQK